MIITLKNKDTLIIDEFRLKCCIGRGDLKKKHMKGESKEIVEQAEGIESGSDFEPEYPSDDSRYEGD